MTGTLYRLEDLLASILPIKLQLSCEVTGDKKLILSSYPKDRKKGYDFPGDTLLGSLTNIGHGKKVIKDVSNVFRAVNILIFIQNESYVAVFAFTNV